MKYRPKSSYFGRTEEARKRQLSNLKSGKGTTRKPKKDDLRYKISDDIITFSERHFFIPETRQPVILLDYEKDFFRDLFHAKGNPTLACLSTPKKCGKSTIAAIVALYVLCTKADAEIYIVGPDIEQSQLVVYSKIRKAIRMNSYLQKFISIKKDQITNRKNDSFIRPLACSSTNAGLNPTLCIFDELWRFTSDEALQTYEELTNIPKEGNLNLIVTYAGHAEDEESILYRLYKQGVAERDGLADKDKCFLFKWYGEELYKSIPWVKSNYLTLQKKRLRPNAYARLHQNLWVSGAESFVDSQIIDECTHSHRKGMDFSGQVCIGVDIGLRHDCSAIAVVGKVDDKTLVLVDHKVFVPDERRNQTIDLESTVERSLLQYNARYGVKEIWFDPYQFQRSAAQLRQNNLKMVEFPQTQFNTVEMSETLSGLLHNQSLMLYENQELRQHLLNSQVKETPRGWRLVKRKQSKKIDLAVALAISCQASQENFLLKNLQKGKIYIEGVVNDWDDGEDDFSLEGFVRERMGFNRLDKEKSDVRDSKKGKIFFG